MRGRRMDPADDLPAVGQRPEGPGERRALSAALLALVLAVAGLVSACTPVGEQASGEAGAAPPVGSTIAPGPPTTAPPPTTTAPPSMSVSFEPPPNATGVRPDSPIIVLARHGELTSMSVVSPSGPVEGNYADGAFSPGRALEFGQTYTVTATARPWSGEPVTVRSVFSTLTPVAEITADIYPTDGEVVGIGMPVIVTFSSAVPAGARPGVTALFTVAAAPAVEGAWRWVDDTTMHWRPRTYWPAGTTVTVTGHLTGHAVGDEWFLASPTQTYAIGPAHRITIDAAAHQMVAYENEQPIRTMPISTGKDAYPTASGVDLIMEKHSSFEMDSSSVGIGGSEAYLVTVADAQRLTYSGTFLHAAPWNTQLGQANTSHGCVNASEADAAWMMEFTLIGDPVEISNTGEQVSWGNGWGDWNLPFEEWASTETP
ncbi:MAG: L,D-transpeptidase family protein [Acidimicrobiia bacterium]|nr:L,D-transpeptidase family protein [Acidimicrobiia bacterium]